MRDLEGFTTGKTHVIWDWNGTLLDDTRLSVDVISELLSEHGLPRLEVEEYRRGFRFPVAEYYAELGFGAAAFAVLSRQFIERYTARLGTVDLFPGVPAMLAGLKARGVACSVLSAAHERDLTKILDHHGIRHHFTHVYGLSDHLAHSKVARGKDLLRVMDTPPHEVVLIGDTDHDAEVAEALGIDAVLVDLGHQTFERLSARHHRVMRR